MVPVPSAQQVIEGGKMSKVREFVNKLMLEENLTTQEVLTKYPDLAKLLEREEQEQKEMTNESKSEKLLLKG